MSKDNKNNLTEQTSFFPLDTSPLVRLVSLKDGFSHNHQPRCGYCQKVLNRIYQGKMTRYCNSKCYSQTEEFKDNLKTDKEDIIQDFVSIITSYCARIYGQRRSKRKTEHLIRELSSNDQII